MPLLKEQQAGELTRDAVVLDLGDLKQQADEIKRRAREEADRIVADARAEAERLTADADQRGYEAGYERGRAEGHEAGRAEGHAEAMQQTADRLEQMQQSWTEAGERWESERRQMLLDARQSLLELALQVARKVVKRVPEVDPSVVVDQVEAAVDQMARPADVALRVHPDDRALIEEAMPTLTDRYDQLQHVKLTEDERIERGGCVLSYGRGRIDATLDQQLQRLVETLLPEREERDEETEGRRDEGKE